MPAQVLQSTPTTAWQA